jgi:hypothetical protein
MPPAGLAMRPVNDASASTCGQKGHKEAARAKGELAGTPCAPARDFVPCAPEVRTYDPQTLCPLRSLKRIPAWLYAHCS